MYKIFTLLVLSLVITACTPQVEPAIIQPQAIDPEPMLEIVPEVITDEMVEDILTEIQNEPLIEEEIEIFSQAETETYLAEQAEARVAEAAVQAEATEKSDTLNILKTGEFVGIDAEHDANGGLHVLEMGDDIILEFQDDFAAVPGPDLYVYLSQPQSFGPKSRKGADVRKMRLISALTNTGGAQMYKISKADWETHGHSVVIWCRQYGYLFGYATLN